MPNERLADLTEADAIELVQRYPILQTKIANADPRVQLHERIYAKPEARADLKGLVRKHKDLFPQADVPELDVPELARAAVKEDLDALKTLRKEIEDDRRERRHQGFRAQIIEAGAEEEDVEKIEAFMVDNEFGTKPTAIRAAVEKYYEASAPAEPNATSGLGFWQPPNQEAAMMKALIEAPPGADLDQVAAPFYEQVFSDMTRGKRARVLG